MDDRTLIREERKKGRKRRGWEPKSIDVAFETPRGKTCKICDKTLIGRTDKKYCSAKCRSAYNNRLAKEKKVDNHIGTTPSPGIKHPLGLEPQKIYNERMKAARFNEVCGAISRYYNARLKISVEWIKEYNELVRSV